MLDFLLFIYRNKNALLDSHHALCNFSLSASALTPFLSPLLLPLLNPFHFFPFSIPNISLSSSLSSCTPPTPLLFPFLHLLSPHPLHISHSLPLRRSYLASFLISLTLLLFISTNLLLQIIEAATTP